MDEAYNLYNAVKKNNLHFLITHNYSGYPLVREMKSLVQNGELGNIRSVRGSYLQGWLGVTIETTSIPSSLLASSVAIVLKSG